MKVLRISEVCEKSGCSRTTVWRLERRGEFPKRVKLSPHLVGWIDEEIVEWIASRPRVGGTSASDGPSSDGEVL